MGYEGVWAFENDSKNSLKPEKKNQLKLLKPKFARRWNISMNKKFYSKAREEMLRRFQERRKMHNLSKKS